MATVPSEKVIPLSGKRLEHDKEDNWFYDRNDDFLDDIDLSESHPMLVDDLLPCEAQGIFHAGGGVGKSTSFAQLLASVAYWSPGETWLNRTVNEPRTGKIILISGDEPLKRIGRAIVATGGREKRDEWRIKHRTREPRIKPFGIDDFNDPLFTANGDEVIPSERWKRLLDLAHKWQPDIVNIDTIAATSALSLDSNNQHGAQLLKHYGVMSMASGGATIGTMHNSKHIQIKSMMDAANAACGASQLVNSGRFAIAMYRAHKELAAAVVQAGLGGADRMKNVIVVGMSKDNITDEGGLEPYVFVRQPRDGHMILPMVEITAQIRELDGGDDLLEGIESASSDNTSRRNKAKETKGERQAREQAEHDARVQRVDELVDAGMSPMDAAAKVDEQDGRPPAATDRWAAKRAEAEGRVAASAELQGIMRQHGVDAFAACKFKDTGKFPQVRKSA